MNVNRRHAICPDYLLPGPFIFNTNLTDVSLSLAHLLASCQDISQSMTCGFLTRWLADFRWGLASSVNLGLVIVGPHHNVIG